MTTTWIVVLTCVFVAGMVLVSWSLLMRLRYRRIVAERQAVLRPLIRKLALHETISESEVSAMASQAPLRYATYATLQAYNRTELFPQELLNLERCAEGFLVTWLEFPTELGEVPHEIELFTTIALDGILNLTYYVFQYRMRNDHWAARYSWMFGVVGPYGPLSKPYDLPAKIFSRFNAISTTTAQDEARWVHENIG